jgi:hypothetical protein
MSSDVSLLPGIPRFARERPEEDGILPTPAVSKDCTKAMKGSYGFDCLSGFDLLDRGFDVATDGVVYHSVDEEPHFGHGVVVHCRAGVRCCGL